jgi:large subunit ribosomal protein L17
MRHQKGVKKLGRNGSHRGALLRNLATELFRHERIRTTEVKAKALRGYAEKLITLGKKGDLSARRLAAKDVQDHDVLRKLFGEIGPRFKERPGGYTRVLKLEHRHGDAAAMALIELVDYKSAAAAAPAADAKAESK